MKTAAKRVLRKLGRALHGKDAHLDLRLELQRIATNETALYIKDRMKGIQAVDSAFAVHDAALTRCGIEGLVLEFGVFTGNSINYIASKRPWIVDGFDSFEGLPESWRDGFAKGHFGVEALPVVRQNVRLHKGWFDDTLPKFLQSDAAKDVQVAYLHIDCDLYSSTRTVFECLGGRIGRGTVIVFDEYFNYDGWQVGEFKAFHEWLSKRPELKYEYITYNYMHEQVAVVLT